MLGKKLFERIDSYQKDGDAQGALEEIFDAGMVRKRAARIFEHVASGHSQHFTVDLEALSRVGEYTYNVIEQNYPSLEVPPHSRWRHFFVGGVDESQSVLDSQKTAKERLRVSLELVVTSVLLDAGAGEKWVYFDRVTDQRLTRSEGLALASLRMFQDGGFSSDDTMPLKVDPNGLRKLSAGHLGKYFQTSPRNPLLGLDGRSRLMIGLADQIETFEEVFKKDGKYRLGHLADYIVENSVDGAVSLHEVLKLVLLVFSGLWHGHHTFGKINLGDTWEHAILGREEIFPGLIPFHKLSQWLTYSLLEPLEKYGLKVTEVSSLTGLAEYRNGGLILDLGLIKWKDRALPGPMHNVGSSLVVEWRALTVYLLDEIADYVRKLASKPDLQLVNVLEGGTWAAGRKIARELREDGGPPINLISDGMVF